MSVSCTDAASFSALLNSWGYVTQDFEMNIPTQGAQSVPVILGRKQGGKSFAIIWFDGTDSALADATNTAMNLVGLNPIIASYSAGQIILQDGAGIVWPPTITGAGIAPNYKNVCTDDPGLRYDFRRRVEVYPPASYR